MAHLQIPVRSDINAYKMTIELDGANYVLGFCYNERLDRYTMSISNTADEEIVAGIPMLTGVDVMGQFRANADLPPGSFWVIDESGESLNPTLDTFGSPCVLLYREVDTV